MTKKLMRTNLPEVLSYLFYEADMFAAIPGSYEANVDRHVKNAVLESFAVHMRNLACFFGFGGRILASDITIDDLAAFLPNWKAPEISPDDALFMKSQIERANKQVAHLTEERLLHRNPVWQWEHVRITKILSAFWRNFEQALDIDLSNIRTEIADFTKTPKPTEATYGATMCSSSVTAILVRFNSES